MHSPPFHETIPWSSAKTSVPIPNSLIHGSTHRRIVTIRSSEAFERTRVPFPFKIRHKLRANCIIIQLPRGRQHLDGEEPGDAPRGELLHDPRRGPQPRDLQPLLSPRIHALALALPRTGTGPRRRSGPKPQGGRRTVERPPRRLLRPCRGRLAWAWRGRARREWRDDEESPVRGRRRRGGGGEGASEQGDHRGDGASVAASGGTKASSPRRRAPRRDLEGRERVCDFFFLSRPPIFSWAGIYGKAGTKSAQQNLAELTRVSLCLPKTDHCSRPIDATGNICMCLGLATGGRRLIDASNQIVVTRVYIHQLPAVYGPVWHSCCLLKKQFIL
jgi:hypothetical protein